MISGGDNPYDVHDAKLSSSATTHESSSMTAHEISNIKISYQKDDITKVAKNLNANEKSLKKAHFNKASLRSPFSDIDFEQN